MSDRCQYAYGLNIIACFNGMQVRPIILKLSIIFPSITFKYYYISEEETYMGFMEIKDGNIYDSYVPDKEKIESLIALI